MMRIQAAKTRSYEVPCSVKTTCLGPALQRTRVLQKPGATLFVKLEQKRMRECAVAHVECAVAHVALWVRFAPCPPS